MKKCLISIFFFESSLSYVIIFLANAIYNCSHLRVQDYYIESVNSKCQFNSTICNGYGNFFIYQLIKYLSNFFNISIDDFKKGKCSCNYDGCSTMGYNSDHTNLEGQYFLFTNQNPPYCKN